MDYLEGFASWYPEHLGNHFYPVRPANPYSKKEREAIYESLSPQQKQLIEHHRKYKIRSLFLKNHYLEATEWKFSTMTVNPHFPAALANGEKLFCECGRPLKYQFVVKSIKTGRKIKLGINHFADHLHVPLEVAREIQKGINEVDLALDQLLWLKKRGIEFPQHLWLKYCYAFYRNNQLKKPIRLNHRLPQRILEFKQAAMPIYIADYQALEQEIRLVDRQAGKAEETHFVMKQPVFENYLQDFLDDLAHLQLFDPQRFLSNKLHALKADYQGSGALSPKYFSLLLAELRKLSRTDHALSQKRFQRFLKTALGKSVDPEISKLVLKMYLKYGFAENFFLAIPKLMRNGLLKAIKQEQQHGHAQFEAFIESIPAVFYQTLLMLIADSAARARKDMLESYFQTIFGHYANQVSLPAVIRDYEAYLQAGDKNNAFSTLAPVVAKRLRSVI